MASEGRMIQLESVTFESDIETIQARCTWMSLPLCSFFRKSSLP